MTESAEVGSIWEQLAGRINPILSRPEVQKGLVTSRLSTRRGQEYFIVKNPIARTYVRLAPDEYYLLGLMDGGHQVKDLVLAYFQKYRRLAPRRVLHLVDELRRHRFLTQSPDVVWAELSARLRQGTWEGWLDAILRTFISREIAFTGIDRAAGAAYRAAGWMLFTRVGASLLVLLGGLGFVLFLRELFFVGRNPLTIGGSTGLGVLTIVGLSLLLIAIHEMGHAMAVKTYGREVNRAGFMMYLGMPAFFVDSSDIWMEPRRPRLVVTAAGPLITWAAGGVAMLYLVLAQASAWTEVAYQLALISFVNNSFNLVPLLELDGYYLLMDWLELPQMRARAFAFVRSELAGKIRRREKFNREDWIFAVYGTLAVAAVALASGFAISFWLGYGEGVAADLLRTHNFIAAVVAAVVVLALVTPVALGAIAKARRFRHIGSVIGYLRHWRAADLARMRVDARGIVDSQRFLQSLQPRDRETIVSQLRLRRFRPGECVVREGERADEFFLIESGRAEVLKLERDWPRQLVILGRGDCFGELALLYDQPRQASVRALTPMIVFSLDRTAFQSIVGPQLRRYGLTRQRLDERAELARVAIFRDTPSSDLDPILDRLIEQEAAAGTDIIREDEGGDRFYIVRRGQVDVLRAGSSGQEEKIAELGPSDYFGELALINDAPRIATVRARGAVALWTLDRGSFLDAIMTQKHLSERVVSEASHRSQGKSRLAVVVANG